MINKFKGICDCDRRVSAGGGTALRENGRWVVRCSGCVKPAAPSIAPLDNGPCSDLAYEDACARAVGCESDGDNGY